MAEQRKKSSSILLSVNGKNISLELFPSEEWPNEPSGEGLFRVRIDGKWHSPFGKYTFMTMPRVGELVAALLTGEEPPAPVCPPTGLVKGARVRAHYGECVAGVPLKSGSTWVYVPPHLGPDGRWWIWLNFYEGFSLVPVDDVEIIGR